MHLSVGVEPTSSGDLVALTTPPPTLREATRRSSPDNPDESTVLDLVELPDNEPTTIWPMLSATVAAAAEPLARGSSGRVARRRTVGKYELREKLAGGAFGVVFSARDPSLDRDIAIKVLRPTHHTNEVIVQRFLHEARATARIAHPGIVTIHDCGQIETNLGETAFIAMELLSGQNLGDRLADVGALPEAEAVEIVRQVASALEAAHRVDVLHRDLKPDNIFLVEDPAMPAGERVKVFDFGLAKVGDRGLTQLESVFGTPHYMSPEQTRSTTQIDHRSDIYALGCILYELLTGRPPFDGSVRAVVEAHQHKPPPGVPGISGPLADLLAQMLAKDPMARPQTMGGVQRELARVTGRAPSQPGLRPSQPADGPWPADEGSRPAPVQAAAPAQAAAPLPAASPLQAVSMMHPSPRSRPPTPSPVAAAASGPHRVLDALALGSLAPGMRAVPGTLAVGGPPPLGPMPSGVLLVPPITSAAPASERPSMARPVARPKLLIYGAITVALIALAVVLAVVTAA